MLKVATPHKRTPAPPSRALLLLLMLCMAALFRMATLAAPAVLLSGCIINLDGSSPGSSMGSDDSGVGSDDSSMGMSTPPLEPLPPPDIWRLELPIFDANQQTKFDEVQQYLAKRYQYLGWVIRATTQGFSGDIFDWISPDSVKGSDAEPPPTPTPEEMQLPDGVQLSLTELDLFPELRVQGAIPVLRPSFAAYIMGLSGASSLEDFLNTYLVPGVPSDQDRLYAGLISPTPNLGASAFINAFNGQIEFGSMNLLEMVVGCRDPNTHEMRQQIGIAASKDWPL